MSNMQGIEGVVSAVSQRANRYGVKIGEDSESTEPTELKTIHCHIDGYQQSRKNSINRSSHLRGPITAWAAISSRLILMNSPFAIIGASNLWQRSKACSVSGPNTSPRPIKRCGAGGPFQAAKPRLTPTYWALLKQPDKHETTTRY